MAGLLFSTAGAAVKLCQFPAWQVAGWRSGIAALTILVLLPSSRRRPGWRHLAVALPYALTVVSFVHANKLTTSASAIYLQATAPLYLALLAPLLLRERPRRQDLVLTAWLAVGLVCFLIGVDPPTATAPAPGTGNLVAAFSGVCYALTILGLRGLERSGGRPADGATAVVFGNGLAFLLCLPPGVSQGEVAFGFVPQGTILDWGAVAYLGVIQLGLGYVLVTLGVRELGALEASMLLLIEPALNPWWAWWLHGERPGVWTWVGGVIVMTGTAALALFERSRSKRARFSREGPG